MTKVQTHVRNPQVLEHTEEMFNLLAAWKMNINVLTAAMLIPLQRHELVPETELIDCFGMEAVRLGRLATRLLYFDGTSELRKTMTSRAANAEKLRRLYVYAYSNLDAALLCMAERIARVQQITAMNDFEQETWALNTMDVYLPLMEMLGLWSHRQDIGNLSLAVTDAALYDQFANLSFLYYKRHEGLFGTLRNTLYQLLENSGVHGVEVTMFEATPASLHRRMELSARRGEAYNPDEVGILRVDVLVKETQDCYLTLGLIHSHWQPAHRHTSMMVEGRFRDYIAAPRYNGYRALVTTVLSQPAGDDAGEHLQLVEFNIRTYGMERVNKYGIIETMQTKEHIPHVWWDNTAVKSVVNPPDTDQLREEIFVFTPTGEVIYPLPKGSTVIDFAFRIHSELGPYARQFWVNGRPVNYQRKLVSRDLVEIEYDKVYPSLKPEWEDAASTSTAKNGIRRHLRMQNRAPHKGRQRIDEVLERETRIYEMRFPEDKVEQALGKIARERHCATLENLYMKVADGSLAPDEIVADMIEAELVNYISLAEPQAEPVKQMHIARSWMQEKEPRKWSKATRVVPGAEIVGRFTGKGDHRRLVVHRKDSPYAPVSDQSVSLVWRVASTVRDAAEITVIAPPQSHIIGMVFNTVYGKSDDQHTLNVHRFDAELQDNGLVIHIVLDAPSFDRIQDTQNALSVLQRGGYINDYKVWHLFPGQKMLLASRLDRQYQNPYTLSKISDQNMFFGRTDEVASIITLLNENQNFIVLYGQKRIGKTSLLFQLAQNLLPAACNVVPVMFDAHSLAPFETVPFLAGLANAAQPRLTQMLTRPEDRKGLRLREPDLQKDPFGTFERWVNHIEKKLQGKKLLFMVDEFTTVEEVYERGGIDQTFFDGLQWLAGNQNVGFVLCVHDHVFRHSSKSWGLLQRGQPIRLGSLDPRSAARLIQQPLERLYTFDSGIVGEMVRLTNCHPYLIQAICQKLTTNMSVKEEDRITADDLQKAIFEVIISGEHYFNHFYSSGDEHGRDMLKIIAYMCDDVNPWVSRDQVRNAMERYNYSSSGMQVSKSIGDLLHADILEASNLQGQALYRIKIGLYHIWLREVATHLVVSRDIQRED